ncbi:P-loop containing nucleoside triphosphate hydrolase [Fusarium oxysporum f. sp. vasinfectum]|nr:P-loop containing nucleoside triphosphate hydrolase [Fusarium oxysporum f. sp. vasinfectum]
MISAMGESARSISSDIKDSNSCCQYQFSAGAKLLWVNGPAGFGKTLLCAHVVEYPSSTLDTLVAHFFFTSDHESREDPFLALRLWISQIVSRHEGAFEYVRQKWESDSDPVATRSTVISLFTQLLHDIPGCTFVADSLDECTSLNNTNNSTAKFLHDVANAIAGTNARLLVLSRDEPEIRYALINDMRESFVEYRIMPKDVRSETAAFSQSIVDRKLPNKSDDIRGIPEERDEQETIQSAIENTPTGLDHLYDRNWTRITGLGEWEKQRAFVLLRWTAFFLPPSDAFASRLTVPAANTPEGERRRRNEAILAVMAYCPVQESPLPRTRNKATVNKDSSPLKSKPSDKEVQPINQIGNAITSVFVNNRNERSRRCFLCIGKATTLQSSDPDIECVISPFYSSGDLSRHFKRHHLSKLRIDEKPHCILCMRH